EYTDDPGRLTKTARKILREKFLAADCGVSGANFLLAEQGAAVVFENEGNARIVRTLPGTVIFITGMEKIIPSVCDLYPFVRLLPASATGQKSTSYLSVVTARSIVESGRTIHMVLIDCGRSRIRANPDFRESLYCIRCGACLNSCPVYKSTGGHAYGAVYQGPIGSVISPLLCGGMKVKHPFASTLCAACGEVCPVKIEIHAMLLKLRHVSGKGMFERALAALAFFFLKNRASYFFGTILLRLFYGVLKIFKARRVLNLFPRPSKKTFREIYGDGNGV
ncbi:MAG: lactate utilization protein, partial [Deltaproteobacteria bacterium]|nr:lactate utilization protein [Deltaproteobacteria bacterium]